MPNNQDQIAELKKLVEELILISKPVMDSYAGPTRLADYNATVEKVNTLNK